MSGIEIAGLLLGALPILFKAVDLSKDSIQRGRFFIRKRHYVKKLALALLLQQQTLAETVRSLLIRSGCEDILLLDDDPVGYLNDECVQNRILDYLGPKNAAAFTGVLKECDDSVRRIAENISDLVPVNKVCLLRVICYIGICTYRNLYMATGPDRRLAWNFKAKSRSE